MIASTTKEPWMGRRPYSLHIVAEDLKHETARLQDKALALFALSLGQKGRPCGSLEHFAHTVAGTGRALQVLVGTNLLANLLALK